MEGASLTHPIFPLPKYVSKVIFSFEKKPPQGISKNAKRFSRDDVKGFVDFVMGLIKKYKDNRIT